MRSFHLPSRTFPLFFTPIRFITTQSFTDQLESLQSKLTTVPSDRRAELLRHGRQLFETEKLDDADTTLNTQNIGKICQVASQLRIHPSKSASFQKVIEYCLSEKAVKELDMDTTARVVHSCFILRFSLLYEILCTYTWPIIHNADKLGGVSVAVILNAYGRAGYHHERLFSTLCKAAAKSMKDPRVSLAHVANVAHALSRVGFSDRNLLLVLRDQAVRQSDSATPIIAITLLDAFATLNFVEEQFFEVYEGRVLSALHDINGPLLASYFTCLVTAGRANNTVVDAIGERILSTVDTLDSASVSKLCKAYADTGILSEEVLGSLAERSCKIAQELRADEIYNILNCLSSFDLFDGELFPLLSGRLASMYKRNEYMSATDAAGVLACFAAVQESSDELAYVCTQICNSQNNIPPSAYINILWACAVLNVRNEALNKTLARVRDNKTLLDLPEEGPGNKSTLARRVLEERREYCLKAYSL